MLLTAFDFDQGFPGDRNTLQLQHAHQLCLTDILFYTSLTDIGSDTDVGVISDTVVHKRLLNSKMSEKVEKYTIFRFFLYLRQKLCYNGTEMSPITKSYIKRGYRKMIFDYRLHAQNDGQEQKSIAFKNRLMNSVDEAIRHKVWHPERLEVFEKEILPVMRELAKSKGALLRVEIGKEAALACMELEGMLVLSRQDMEIIQQLLPHEIMVRRKEDVLSLEVWQQFWDVV